MSDHGIVEERVQRGLDWLRKEGPQYGLSLDRLLSDPEAVDINDPCSCALAIAGDGTYFEVMEKLFEQPGNGPGRAWAQAHGFWPDYLDYVDSDDLTDSWRRLLTAVGP